MTEIPKDFPLPEEAFLRQRTLLAAHLLERHGGGSRRRGLVVAVTAAAAVGALLVSPAFGLGERLLDLLQGPPAPPEVQAHFAASDALRRQLFAYSKAAGRVLHDRFSPVVAAEARGIAAIESRDGPIYLWAAPTEDGRHCWLIQAGAEVATGRPYGLGSCDAEEVGTKISPRTFWTAERPNVKIVHARVYDDAVTSVEIVVEGGMPVSLPVVAGHVLGTVAKGAAVLAFVARDAEGHEVTRRTLPDRSPPAGD
jgi:hypothetical protein